MAWTAHKTDDALEETVWTDEAVDAAAKKTAELVRKAKKVVFFTGAGISTSAGIPDYRGPQGVWTLAAQGKERSAKTTAMASAIPTPTHMALVALHKAGKLDFLISMNVDGLHRRSGIPHTHIAELHGNSTIEECDTCGKQVSRYFSIHQVDNEHNTGRFCPAKDCPGKLKDTIINFGEDLPRRELEAGFEHSDTANVHICLGTSLTVAPANQMPASTKEHGGSLIIVNKQKTPLDKMADVRVFGPTDYFMERLLHHLGIIIPPFVMEHRLTIWESPSEACGTNFNVTGVLEDGTVSSLLEKAQIGEHVAEYTGKAKDPSFSFPATALPATGSVTLKLQFFDHYHEPPMELKLSREAQGNPSRPFCVSYLLRFSPEQRQWISVDVEPERNVVPDLTRGCSGPGRVVAKPKAPKKGAINDGTGIDYSSWFAVTPLHHCEHCESVNLTEGVVLDPTAPCKECGNVGENMQCLSCFTVLCGRHVKGHMLAHHEATGHSMVVGFADLSFWCYPCEAYLEPLNRHLRYIYKALHIAKFPDAPFSRLAAAADQPATVASCMHTKYVSNDTLSLARTQKRCETCSSKGEESLLCLECLKVFCGSTAEGHIVAHHEETGHRMALQVATGQTYCFLCSTFVASTANERIGKLSEEFKGLKQ